jgi:hypothetical protein
MEKDTKIILAVVGAGALLYLAYPMLYPATESGSKANKPGANIANLYHNINERVIIHGGPDQAQLSKIKADKMMQKEGYETNNYINNALALEQKSTAELEKYIAEVRARIANPSNMGYGTVNYTEEDILRMAREQMAFDKNKDARRGMPMPEDSPIYSPGVGLSFTGEEEKWQDFR